MRLEFDVVLKQKPADCGLVGSEIMDLYEMCLGYEVYPIDLEARSAECAAMGFISVSAAEKLDYDYEGSGFHDFIASILDDMEKENEMGEYEFTTKDGRTLSVYLSA